MRITIITMAMAALGGARTEPKINRSLSSIAIRDMLIERQFQFPSLIWLLFGSLQVEAGDVILKVNGTDVHCYTTKEGESGDVL